MPTGPGPSFRAPPGLPGEKPLPAPGSGRGAFIGPLGPLPRPRALSEAAPALNALLVTKGPPPAPASSEDTHVSSRG